MLPGSECGDKSICYLDQCVSENDLDSSLLNSEFDDEILDLTTHCSSGQSANELAASNQDPHYAIECINWENDFLCKRSQACPTEDDSSTQGLYIKHVCCGKCSTNFESIKTIFSRAKLNQSWSIFIITVISFLFFV